MKKCCGHFIAVWISFPGCNRGIAGQGISNVPAALLLSGFTDNYKALLLGVNIGGLGTLIASMASLISYKILAHQYNEKKGKYFLVFTLLNLLYLLLLLGFATWKLSFYN